MTGKDLVSLWWATILSQEDIGRTELMNLAANIDAALAAEREACANTVHETLKFQSCMCCQRAMNAIRARRTP